MNPPALMKLEHRSDESVLAYLRTVPLLAGYQSRPRDSNQALTLMAPDNGLTDAAAPDADPSIPAPRPYLLVKSTDTGRYKQYLPIRIMRVEIELRGNAKTPGGEADPFDAIGAAIESLLDGINPATNTNLTQGLNNAAFAFYCGVATRQPANQFNVDGLIRRENWVLELKCCGTEHTTNA